MAAARWLWTFGPTTIAEVDVAWHPPAGSSSSCATPATARGQAFEANMNDEHLFVFDITSSSVSLSVDCVPLDTRPAQITLATRANLTVAFGKADASPIDGTIDDLGVSFR